MRMCSKEAPSSPIVAGRRQPDAQVQQGGAIVEIIAGRRQRGVQSSPIIAGRRQPDAHVQQGGAIVRNPARNPPRSPSPRPKGLPWPRPQDPRARAPAPPRRLCGTDLRPSSRPSCLRKGLLRGTEEGIPKVRAQYETLQFSYAQIGETSRDAYKHLIETPWTYSICTLLL